MAKLWIGQPNYSSWSLRGWLICKIAELNPEIEWIRFDQDEWRDQVPSRGLVPALETDQGLGFVGNYGNARGAGAPVAAQ